MSPFAIISCPTSISLPGIAFFVFSEKLNVYEDENPDYIEKRDAGKAFVGSITRTCNSVPLYKYFPTRHTVTTSAT